MYYNEKVLKKWKGNRSRKTQLHKEYKCSLQKTDKLLKYKEREYQLGLCIDLESTKTNNPQDFFLGIVLDELLNFANTANEIASSASRALWAIIGKFRDIKNTGLKLLHNCLSDV